MKIISRQHMLHFTFHLWLLMHSVLSQSQPACQHVMTDLWAKGTAASSRGFLKNANPHSVKLCWAFPRLAWACAQRRLSHGGIITRLYVGYCLLFLFKACGHFFVFVKSWVNLFFFVWKMLYIYKYAGNSLIWCEEFKVKHRGQSQQCWRGVQHNDT